MEGEAFQRGGVYAQKNGNEDDGVQAENRRQRPSQRTLLPVIAELS